MFPIISCVSFNCTQPDCPEFLLTFRDSYDVMSDEGRRRDVTQGHTQLLSLVLKITNLALFIPHSTAGMWLSNSFSPDP